jgi:hypothetical protein
MATEKQEIDKLNMVLHLAVRTIMNLKKFDHVSLSFRELKWLPMAERIHLKILTLVTKSLFDMLPKYLSDDIVIYRPNRPLRSGDKERITLVLGSARRVIGRGDWRVCAPIMWNGLPEQMRTIINRTSNGLISDINKYLLQVDK